jgi:hypothetical protein
MTLAKAKNTKVDRKQGRKYFPKKRRGSCDSGTSLDNKE